MCSGEQLPRSPSQEAVEAAGAVENVVFDRKPLDAPSNSYLFIMPVLFIEFLAIAVTRSLLPGRLNAFFGDRVYLVIGVAETVKGLLAFGSCPLFGKLSDVVGRRPCLVVTVFGTILPCFCPAFTDDLWVYVTALGLSGLFAGTFTLVFAYISDVVSADDRAAAYGLALATLGLSFTVGPPLGAFAARKVGQKLVFLVSLALAVVDVLFVSLALPESRPSRQKKTTTTKETMHLFDPMDTLGLFRGDPLLSRVAIVVLLYYSGVWALVTTLVIYVVRVFSLSTTQVGWLLGTYGLSTMLSEAGLVRCVVPCLGERNTIRVGLVAFALQCVAVAVATSPTLIWASISLSLLSNLVYPAVSSLVSRSVHPSAQGEALGAVNGVKAVTEGAGPLAFAGLMSTFERTSLPGLPYLACALVAAVAFAVTFNLPSDDEYAAFRAKAETRDRTELVALLDDQEEGGSSSPGAGNSADFYARSSRRRDPYSSTTTTTRQPPTGNRRQPPTASYSPGLTTTPVTFGTTSSGGTASVRLPVPAPQPQRTSSPRSAVHKQPSSPRR